MSTFRTSTSLLGCSLAIMAAAALSSRSASAVTISRGTSLALGQQTACPQTLPGATDTANNWRSAMAAHSIPLSANDGTLYWDEFADKIITGGHDSDPDNIDGAQATIVATHGVPIGGWTTMTDMGFYLSSTTGDPTPDCNVRASEMVLGPGWFYPGQSKIFVAAACHSMQMEWYIAKGKQPYLQTGWHQFHGFHGIWNTLTAPTMDDYVNDSFTGPTSVAWVENQSVFDAWQSTLADICAVAIVTGDTYDQVYDRIDHERYNNILYDNVTQTDSWALVYYSNCDPNAGNSVGSYL